MYMWISWWILWQIRRFIYVYIYCISIFEYIFIFVVEWSCWYNVYRYWISNGHLAKVCRTILRNSSAFFWCLGSYENTLGVDLNGKQLARSFWKKSNSSSQQILLEALNSEFTHISRCKDVTPLKTPPEIGGFFFHCHDFQMPCLMLHFWATEVNAADLDAFASRPLKALVEKYPSASLRESGELLQGETFWRIHVLSWLLWSQACALRWSCRRGQIESFFEDLFSLAT